MNNIFSTTQIGLAHFNNKTLQENRDWKKEKGWDGAVYGFQYSDLFHTLFSDLWGYNKLFSAKKIKNIGKFRNL